MRRVLWRRFDWPTLILVLLLGGFGILMIASALSGNPLYGDYYRRQAGFLVIGLGVLFFVAAIDYRLLTTLTGGLYLAVLVFLLVIAAIGTTAGGAQRWLTLGELFLQPSELVKLTVILVLAKYLANNEEKMGRFGTPVGAVLLMAPAVVLIYLQPNLGTAISVVVIGGVMLLMAGLRLHHAVMLAGLAAAAGVAAWRFVLEGYMKTRVEMFLHPAAADAADRFNVDQAMISIGSGGWLGRGLFRGSQSQLHFLRVRHTDFIFSVTAEELGFVGAVILILLVTLLLLRLVYIARLSRDTFGRLLVTGVATMIMFQFVINVGMNLSLLPVTGLPLPLVSYGGSSLWTTLAGIGLAQSVAMRYKKIEFE